MFHLNGREREEERERERKGETEGMKERKEGERIEKRERDGLLSSCSQWPQMGWEQSREQGKQLRSSMWVCTSSV